MITKARDDGLIKGLIPELVEGGLTHLQYVDGIVLFFETNNQSIAHVKFLLYRFERMYGLKINYHKSEVVLVVAQREESVKVVVVLNCKEGLLPMNTSECYGAIHYRFDTGGSEGRKKTPNLAGNTSIFKRKINVNREQPKLIAQLYNGCILTTREGSPKMDSTRTNFYWDSGQKKNKNWTQLGLTFIWIQDKKRNITW